jgi:Fungal protein kinase
MNMLLCTRRLSHTLLQSSLFNSPLRHYHYKASYPIVPSIPGLTPHHGSTHSVSESESVAPSLEGSQETRFQSKMKALIERELRGATYYVDLTTEDGILHADPRIVEVVNDGLRATFQALISGGHSSATKPRFPINRFSRETRSYRPLVQLLNKIIDTANRYMPRSQLSGLHFYPFRGEVKETPAYDSHMGLKPDGVGIISKLSTKRKKSAKKPAKEPELSWEQIEVFIASKSSVKNMLRKSGTFARCCLIGNQRRFFSFGIGFDYKKMEAYVLVFHRSGLSSSRPLKLTTREGFKGLVKYIVGILSFKDEAAYGLDTTRFQKFFRINNRYYEIDHLLYMSGSFRGRSTTVYRLQGMYTCGF